VIAVDTNLLVYAHREDASWHESAYRSIERLATGVGSWAIPWPCVHEFLAIVTHARIYVPPTPVAAAVDQVSAWLEAPGVVLLAESEEYWPRLQALLTAGRITGAQVHDARVAALCLYHGVEELWTADRDFSRFPELRTRNPLID
jgi:toxin-antitoxin system PIN domain toxin